MFKKPFNGFVKLILLPFTPSCSICRRLATKSTESIISGNEIIKQYLPVRIRHRHEMNPIENLWRKYPLCDGCYEIIKAEAQSLINSKKDQEELLQKEKAQQNYYENLKHTIELKELENRAKELGIEIKETLNR